MPYDAPGRADALSPELAERWNATIARDVRRAVRSRRAASSRIDDGALADRAEVDAVHWPGDPLEPLSCFDEDVVRALTDWGRPRPARAPERVLRVRRRAAAATRPARCGPSACSSRPSCASTGCASRSTTPLSSAWPRTCSARRRLRRALRRRPARAGRGREREIAFGHEVAGHGNDDALASRGVPPQPTRRAQHGERAVHDASDQRARRPHLHRALRRPALLVARRDGLRQAATRDDIFSASSVRRSPAATPIPRSRSAPTTLVQQARRSSRSRTRSGCTSGRSTRELSSPGGSRCPTTGCASAAARGATSASSSARPTTHDAFLDDIVVSAGQRPTSR